MSHVTHMNESCRTSHTWMSHVTHMDESCHTHGWVMSHTWMRHVSHMTVSCHTRDRVMSHIQMSHVSQKIAETSANYWGVGSCEPFTCGRVMSHENESWHTHEWITRVSNNCRHGRKFWGCRILRTSRSFRISFTFSLLLPKAGTRYDISMRAYSDYI